VDVEEVESLNKPLGSEDQIIPESDGENNEDEGPKPLGTGRRLNLSRFLYT
jgi:exonuclease-1